MLVQTEPPPMRTPFGQVSAPEALPVGTNWNFQRTRPVAASSAATIQAHALSAPDVPMKSMPFQTLGEPAMVELAPSASVRRVVQAGSPVALLYAITEPSRKPRKTRSPPIATPRTVPPGPSMGWRARHRNAQVAALIGEG